MLDIMQAGFMATAEYAKAVFSDVQLNVTQNLAIIGLFKIAGKSTNGVKSSDFDFSFQIPGLASGGFPRQRSDVPCA